MANRYNTIKIGDKFVTNEGYNITVINYINSSNVEVMFDDLSVMSTHTVSLKCGRVKNLNNPSMCGIGFIGHGKHELYTNGKPTKSYATWGGMFDRCYSTSRHYPTYKNCVVSKSWYCFQDFSSWYYDKLYKFIDCGVKMQLDKDLLSVNGHGKLYSPDTCTLLPDIINTGISNSSRNGKYLPGTDCVKSGKFRSKISRYGADKFLGTFSREIDAHNLYTKEKIKYIKELAIKYKEVLEDRAFEALMNWTPKEVVIH